MIHITQPPNLGEMVSPNGMKKDIIQKFNEEYKDDLMNLEKLYDLKKYYENEIKQIKAELNLQNPSSSITQTVRNTNEILEEIGEVLLQGRNVIKEVSVHLNETNEFKNKLEEYFVQLNMLESTLHI